MADNMNVLKSIRELSGRTLKIETLIEDDGVLTTFGVDINTGDIFIFEISCEESDGTYGQN